MTGSQKARLRDLGDRNVVAAFASVIPHVGGRGELRRFGSVVLVFGDTDHPFFNRIFVLDPRVEVADIAMAVEHVRGFGREPLIQVRDDIDRRLGPDVRGLGFEPDSWASPSMVLQPIPASLPAPPDGLRVVELEGGHGAGERMAAWHDAAGSGAVMRQALPPSILDDASFRVLLGHDAEGPACRSIAVGSESDFGIYAVGTVERARMHGFGTAVTWAAIEAGRRAWGLDAVALQSSEMAVGVYSKMGFVEVCRYVEYQAPTGVPVA